MVTGGTGTIGTAVVRRLAGAGWTVIATGRRPAADPPPGVRYLAMDVTDAAAVIAAADAIAAREGRPGLVVHCAGIIADNLVSAMSPGDWDAVWAVDFQGTVNVVETFAPRMAAAGGGAIIALGSAAGIQGKAGQANYAAAKGAACGYCLAAAQSYGPAGVRINVVIPGYVPGRMAGPDTPAGRRAHERSVLGRFTGANEVAAFIADTAANSAIAGQLLRADSRIGI